MKLFFSFIFLLFSSLSFHTQAQVFIEHEIINNMDQFDWLAFSDKETIRSQIEHENEIFKLLGSGPNIISSLNIGKSDLIRLEQELELYKRGIKIGLPVDIGEAEEAIQLHWNSVNSIENQIKAYAGLGGSVEVMPIAPMIGEAKDYYNGVWELHKGDHEIVFNMVEKKDEALYKALGANDEAYAEFIAPYVERYMGKMGGTAQAYYNSLGSGKSKAEFRSSDVFHLVNMYANSVEIYKCFTKNFKSPVGMNQQGLMGSIQAWHTNQALLGANSIIEAYKTYGVETRPGAVTMRLFKFYEAPDSVKEKIGVFLRGDILNNEEFINTENGFKLKARVDALIGLNYLGVSIPEEQELYNKAVKQGIIRTHKDNPHSFFGRPVPLP